MLLFKQFINKHRYQVCIFVIILLAFFLRFYNYQNRWGLAYDQARDVMVARYAVENHKLPLIGPFSSAGQFVYGPQWFWILMIFTILYPFSFFAPWIFQTLIYVLIIYFLIKIGESIENKTLGIIAGILMAVSPRQIDQAINLTSPSMVGIFSVITLLFFVRYINKQKSQDAFLMSFFIANSINIHFQAIGLLFLIPLAFIFDKKKSYKKFFVLILGIIIPFIPLVIFDLTNNFFESKNWLDYYLHGQYNIYIPNRWLIYAGVFWPNEWANIIGGQTILGYISIALLSIFLVISFIKRTISKSILSIILAFLAIFVILRYYRGERITSYYVFLHPYIIILTSWVIYKLYNLKKMLGILFISLLVFFSLVETFPKIRNAENFTAFLSDFWKKKLITKYPDKKFAIYDYQYARKHHTLPLVLFLDSDSKISDDGVKVGLVIQTSKNNFSQHKAVIGDKGGYQFFDLNSSSSAQLSKEGWAFVNPSAIYQSTVEWYKDKKL